MQNLEKLLDVIKYDYAQFMDRGQKNDTVTDTMIESFNKGLRIEEGRKFIKVITQNSVWGFIVKKGDAKFKEGDILKAASWAAPAKNQARGNVIDGDFSWVKWTGPKYLV